MNLPREHQRCFLTAYLVLDVATRFRKGYVRAVQADGLDVGYVPRTIQQRTPGRVTFITVKKDALIVEIPDADQTREASFNLKIMVRYSSLSFHAII